VVEEGRRWWRSSHVPLRKKAGGPDSVLWFAMPRQRLEVPDTTTCEKTHYCGRVKGAMGGRHWITAGREGGAGANLPAARVDRRSCAQGPCSRRSGTGTSVTGVPLDLGSDATSTTGAKPARRPSGRLHYK
jgi:hypothetical protein